MTPTGTEARVCAAIAQRQQLGIAKYGTTVEDNPLSLRQWLQHGLEEALDLAVYIQRSIDEIDAMEDAPTRPRNDAEWSQCMEWLKERRAANATADQHTLQLEGLL